MALENSRDGYTFYHHFLYLSWLLFNFLFRGNNEFVLNIKLIKKKEI